MITVWEWTVNSWPQNLVLFFPTAYHVWSSANSKFKIQIAILHPVFFSPQFKLITIQEVKMQYKWPYIFFSMRHVLVQEKHLKAYTQWYYMHNSITDKKTLKAYSYMWFHCRQSHTTCRNVFWQTSFIIFSLIWTYCI